MSADFISRWVSGTNTMALLEKLESGSVYLVKISASNQAGDGPFSSTVELRLTRRTHHSHAQKTGTPHTSDQSTSHALLFYKSNRDVMISEPRDTVYSAIYI